MFNYSKFLTALLITMLFGMGSIKAHNGAAAFAYPVSNITLDGDLRDWPSGLHTYPIRFLESGDKAENDQDLSSHFRVGYDMVTNRIYLAVIIKDQSIMLDTTQNINWDTHDGMELYLDPDHLRSVSAVTQYSLYATERMIFGHKKSWEGIEVASKLVDDGRVYEWSINPGYDLKPGISLSFDLVAVDKDADDSFSWVAWGRNSQKLFSPNNCGDLVLLESGTEIVSAQGKLDKGKLLSNQGTIPVRFTSQQNSDFYLYTLSDSTGAYSLSIPAGDYYMDIPTDLMPVDEKFYRIADNKPIAIKFETGTSTKLPVLTPQQSLPEVLKPQEGILHAFDQNQQKELDKFVEIYREYYAIPGVSLALIKDGAVVYYRTYGVKDANTGEPVNEETLFEAASITKPVFAFAVLSLAEKGIIDLDKPLYEYLPFEALEEYPEYKKMTARHVLIHRTGLPNWGQRMEREPGVEYGYSGEGFEYLKRVVIEITGKDVEQVLDEELINPQGLYHMEFKDSKELRKVVSSGHLGNHPTGWGLPQGPGMASTMHTEAKAFSQFALALLHEEGLNEKTYVELAKIHTESPSEYWNSPDYREGAGLGVHVRESSYGKVIGHGGNNGDFKCLFEVYQDLDMGYVVFTNSNMGDQLAYDLAEFLVEGRDENNRTTER